MAKDLDVGVKIMLLEPFDGTDLFIPSGSKGVIDSIGTHKDPVFNWDMPLYNCTLEDYPNITLKVSSGAIVPLVDEEFFVIYDVLKRNIYRDWNAHYYKTVDEAVEALSVIASNCGQYTVAICNQDMKIQKWICWQEDVFDKREENDDDNRYYGVVIPSKEKGGNITIMQSRLGHRISTDLNDLIPWLHNEKAWKSGLEYYVVELGSMDIYAIVPPPRGTPIGGIIQHDFNAFGQEQNQEEEEEE